MRNVLIIAKKELFGYLHGATAYVVAVIFLVLWEFLYFQTALLIGEASLRTLFYFLPWLFLLLIPSLTMGSVAQEKSEGTLELLLTHPVRDAELLLGKFFAVFVFVAALLLFIFPVGLTIDMFGDLDWGAVAAQYIAGVFMAAEFIALGILVSALFASQIAALLASASLIFFLIVAGLEFITASLPFSVARIFEQLSASTHFESMARGVIDTRDVWYFLSAAAVFLSVAYLFLAKRRMGNKAAAYWRYRIFVLLLVAIAVLTNIASARIPGRIDMTDNRLYTLSEVTKKTLQNLSDIVHIKLFASRELPAQYQSILRETKDMLRDYRTFGNGKVVVEIIDPSAAEDGKTDAAKLGVQEVQFNVIGKEEFQVKNGYFGLAVVRQDAHESIPFIQGVPDLEYQLTGFIKKLTTAEKKNVAFLAGHGEKSLYSEFRILNEELQKQFRTSLFTIDESDSNVPATVDVLVIAGPTRAIGDAAHRAVAEYLSAGGSVFALVDATAVNPQTLYVSRGAEDLSGLLSGYGISVKDEVVYDLRMNETIRLSGGMVSYIMPYPFWARVMAADKTSPTTMNIESIVLPWANPVAVDVAKVSDSGFIAKKLFETTEFGGTTAAEFSAMPDFAYPQEPLSRRTVAVSLQRPSEHAEEKTARIVVAGNSSFLADQFVAESPQGLAFGIAAISWLGQEESLAQIGLKQIAERKLFFRTDRQIYAVKYGNLAFAFLVPFLFGTAQFVMRNRLKKRVFQK